MIYTSIVKFLFLLIPVSTEPNSSLLKYKGSNTPDSLAIGKFKDDYGITYTINDTLWVQHPNAKYHIIKWNKEEQYIIAKNDEKNSGDAGLYSRIDYMKFDNMQPWLWGFCLTSYNALSAEDAEKTASADKLNPKKGCNGFPFSRMKKE